MVSGESSLQGIVRELNEEIGININQSEIKLVKEIIEERTDISFFRDIYLIRKDIDLRAIKYNDGEVVNAKYVTIDEFNSMLLKNEILEYLRYFSTLYKKIKGKWVIWKIKIKSCQVQGFSAIRGFYEKST